MTGFMGQGICPTYRHRPAFGAHAPRADEILCFHGSVEQFNAARAVILNAQSHIAVLLRAHPYFSGIVTCITPL